jgi:adenylate kinase
MVFVGGIHGVGKSYFCEAIKETLGFDTYSASNLIVKRKNAGFSKDKLIPDIDDNQAYLLSAIDDLNTVTRQYLLDGHFCLLNANGQVQRIPQSTFTSLKPDAIILLTEKADVIIQRRKDRDNVIHSKIDIQLFQDEEISYAKEVAAMLNIPIYISLGSEYIEITLEFVQSTMRGIENGR